MKNLFNYNNFLNEKKKVKSPLDLFKEDVKSILDIMFAKVKSPKYDYDKDGYPTKVEFEIEKSDFIVDYEDDLTNDFSEGVLKKRESIPVLTFDEKEEEGKETNKTYKISFKIKKDNQIDKKDKRPRYEQFERDSDDQLLAKLKSKKVTDANKEKIIDILKGRGVKYDDPFKVEDEEMSEEEMMKAAEKEAKKANESIVNEKSEDCGCECDKEKKDEKDDEKDDEKVNENCGCGEKKNEEENEEDEKEGETCECGSGDVSVSFGSEKWQERHNLKLKEEKTEKSLNELVNESLKIKKIDDFETLNEKVNNITYKENKPLETIKKLNENFEDETTLEESLYGYSEIIKEIEDKYDIKKLSDSLYELLEQRTAVSLNLGDDQWYNWQTIIVSVDPTLFHYTFSYYEEDENEENPYTETLDCGYAEDWSDYLHTAIKLIQDSLKELTKK